MKETLEHIKQSAWSLPPEQNEKTLVEVGREEHKEKSNDILTVCQCGLVERNNF